VDFILRYVKLLNEYHKYSMINSSRGGHYIYINVKDANELAADILELHYAGDAGRLRPRYAQGGFIYGPLECKHDIITHYHISTNDLGVKIKDCEVKVGPVTEPTVHFPEKLLVFDMSGGLGHSFGK
jgi:hypothetical protein